MPRSPERGFFYGHKALDNPQKNIITKGGFIVVALYQGEPVGVCAMMKMNDPI